MRSDIGRGKAHLRISGSDPRFGGLDCLSGGRLLRLELVGFVATVRGELFKPLGLGAA